jgi:hypothetical protein
MLKIILLLLSIALPQTMLASVISVINNDKMDHQISFGGPSFNISAFGNKLFECGGGDPFSSYLMFVDNKKENYCLVAPDWSCSDSREFIINNSPNNNPTCHCGKLSLPGMF